MALGLFPVTLQQQEQITGKIIKNPDETVYISGGKKFPKNVT